MLYLRLMASGQRLNQLLFSTGKFLDVRLDLRAALGK